jgi:uncharacterized protein GlcG (DUF336 family)
MSPDGSVPETWFFRPIRSNSFAFHRNDGAFVFRQQMSEAKAQAAKAKIRRKKETATMRKLLGEGRA